MKKQLRNSKLKSLSAARESIDRWCKKSNRFVKQNPYARLMRLDKPVGIYLTLLPALWAIAFTAHSILWGAWLFVVFLFGAVMVRSAGCIINDIVDRDLDAKVKRTAARPLASGELSVNKAMILLAGMLALAFIILMTLPRMAIYVGIFSIIPIAIYPWMKRITFFPQVFLGFVFNLGVLMGWFAADPRLSVVAFTLYIGAILWTVGYDTIYAFQDIDDDIEAGVKSMAIYLQESAPAAIWKMYLTTILCIVATGLNMHMNILFYLITCIGAYQLYWQIETLDIYNKKDCAAKFRSNVDFGLIILVGILVGRI
ncbi:MAG: 4-hydroxybenzoate octaprenyltransferase [Rickettsiales bacterium]